jgi:hypothetical protein
MAPGPGLRLHRPFRCAVWLRPEISSSGCGWCGGSHHPHVLGVDVVPATTSQVGPVGGGGDAVALGNDRGNVHPGRRGAADLPPARHWPGVRGDHAQRQVDVPRCLRNRRRAGHHRARLGGWCRTRLPGKPARRGSGRCSSSNPPSRPRPPPRRRSRCTRSSAGCCSRAGRSPAWSTRARRRWETCSAPKSSTAPIPPPPRARRGWSASDPDPQTHLRRSDSVLRGARPCFQTSPDPLSGRRYRWSPSTSRPRIAFYRHLFGGTTRS